MTQANWITAPTETAVLATSPVAHAELDPFATPSPAESLPFFGSYAPQSAGGEWTSLPSQRLSEVATLDSGINQTPRNRALELVQRDDTTAIRRYRQGFLQRAEFSGLWLGSSADNDLQMQTLQTSVTVAVPLGSFENLLIVTPGLRVNFLSDVDTIVVPSTLYDTGIDFMWRKQYNDRWGVMLAVRPAISSDFDTSEDGFRLTGRALATYQMVPERLALLFGVVYLDRNDLSLLPGAGLIWTPTPDWRLDLIFPRPKLARRISFVPRESEQWLYLRGALGGRTWAVEPIPGSPDQLTLRDYRLTFGWERVRDGGRRVFAECGYVFGRELEYEYSNQYVDFSDAFVIQLGITL